MNTRRLAALLEVFGIYAAGQLVSTGIVHVFGLHLTNPLARFTADVTDAELVADSWQLFILLAVQYSGWFLFIIPMNYWRRRRGPAAYGLTRAGKSWIALLVIGVATAAVSLWFTLGIDFLNALHPIGETAPWRQALFDTSWRRWQFWLFTGVISWGFVATIEEIFFRGYCQRRLAEAWGDGPAIVAVTCLFAFAHTQYLTLNAYNAAKLPSLLVAATGSAVAFAWTGSLVPSIVSHAISNVTMTPFWQGTVVMMMVAGTLLFARRAMRVVTQVFSGASASACIALGLFGTGYVIVVERFRHVSFIALGMVCVAIVLEWRDARDATSTTLPDPQ
jgi:membrane protease YdiL (CAAX protease family)